MIKIKQGADAPILITIKDAAGDPVVINSLVDYKVFLYREANVTPRTLALVFAKTPASGEKAITVVNSTAGQIRIIADRDWSKSAAPGVYSFELKIKTSASSDFVSSQMVSVNEYKKMFELESSINPA